MKLLELTLRNFRCFDSQRFELGPLNLFVGANGVGKSSVATGVEFLLTGRVHGIGGVWGFTTTP